MPFTAADEEALTRDLLALKDHPHEDYDWVKDLPLAPEIDDTDELSTVAFPVTPPRKRSRSK